MTSWSPQQDAALMAVRRWLRAGSTQQVFRLFGFAGTGKTTLANEIAASVYGQVIFGAYTGKAALVLKSKGCADAATIHSLIYKLRDEAENGQPRFELNKMADIRRASLVIIDECSMVDEELGTDLLSFGVPILVLGDPAQLPPVNGGGFFTEGKPDVMLTEIHRQAADNPIIHLSTMVREGRRPQLGTYGESRIARQADLEDEDILGADQVLVGTNRSRRNINSWIRDQRGFVRSLPGYSDCFPVTGERLVCLRNNRERGLLNGGLWDVRSFMQDKLYDRDFLWLGLWSADGATDDSKTVRVLEDAISGKTEFAQQPNYLRKHFDDFDYGYALTVHKAQGSQWDRVFLVEESGVFGRNDPDNARRWLYTALTRAAEKVTVML